MSLLPRKRRSLMWLALRPLDDSDEFWREELRAAALEAAVACAPVIVAGAFELYIARERERMKLERERIKAALQHINESGEE